MSKRYPGGIIRKTPQTPSQTSAQGIWDMASVTQAVKENTWPIAGVPDPISKSLRFRSSASAYLNRTPASAGNRRTWTFSTWIKLGEIAASNGTIFAAGTASGETTRFYLRYTGSQFQTGYGSQNLDTTSAVYRDPSAWYHLVLAVDTTQATAANRLKIYVNGVQQAVSTSVNYTQNVDTAVNNSVTHSIARDHIIPGGYFDGYLTETYLIDGQALTPSSFGNTNDQTGVWQPIAYTGTYGTNGFYLPFSNTASTTTLGNDFSGNSNNWTTNNISLTSGTTYDSMVDVPTPWIPYNTAGDTGALFRGNYAVLNPLWKGANITPTDGNLTNPLNSGSPNAALSTMPMSTGKWYAEMTNTASYGDVGLCIVAANLTAPTFTIGSTTQTGLWEVYDNGGGIYVTSDGGAFSSSLGATRFRPAGTIQFAYDASNGYFWIGRNNTWYDSSFGTTGNPSTGANPTFTISSSRGPFNIGAGSNSATNAQYWNFGQRPFSYTPPSGFKTLNTTNLPTPTIGATATTQAGDYFDAITYTGAGGTQTISGLQFQPDFIWGKARSAAYSHALFDSVRGYGSTKGLVTNSTAAEGVISAQYGFVSTNTSTGFTAAAGTDGTNPNAALNESGVTYVAWNWKANGTGVTNTAGTITSTVSANTTAGFSIVTYSGNGTNGATVGHGLGVAPSMVIIKGRNASTGASEWVTQHQSLSGGVSASSSTFTLSSYTSVVYLSGTYAAGAYGFDAQINGASGTYVAYCFAQVAGYSAFGSYTGNGSSDGPFIYTGFRPRFVMIKQSSSSNYWWLKDSARSPTNQADLRLAPNLGNAESNDAAFNGADFLSNGFKLRGTDTTTNQSGGTYIYMAFAESPFKYALAR